LNNIVTLKSGLEVT